MRITLVGTPNVGKSTLFNALTGLKQQTVNSPGTTVALEVGRWRQHVITDLPGMGSLATISPDEDVAVDVLAKGRDATDVIVLVADGAHIAHSLYLLAGLRYSNIPIVLAVTMMDVAKRRNISFTAPQLSDAIGGIPVVFVDGRRETGFDELNVAIDQAINTSSDTASGTTSATSTSSDTSSDTTSATKQAPQQATPNQPAWNDEVLAESSDISSNSVQNDGVAKIAQFARKHADEHFEWAANVERKLGLHGIETSTFTDKLDSILLNTFAGPIVFLITIFVVFWLTTSLSTPFIDFFDGTLREWISSFVTFDGWFASLLVHGIIDAVITVLTFLPPMFFMFVSVALLEASGYLARAAVVADRLMRLIGLDGRALLPIIVGFGCNLPAVSGTKILPDSRSRRLTTLLIPFTLCSARLAVFMVIAHAIFPKHTAIVIFLLYVASCVALVIVGLVFKRVFFKSAHHAPFIISLPAYQLPLLKPLVRSVGAKLIQFTVEAGRIIVAVILVMWVLQSVPTPGAVDDEGEKYTFAQVEDVHDSLYGVIADGMAPIFTPAGFGDWHFASALTTGFVAKEVFVGALSQTFSLEEVDEEDLEAVAESGLSDSIVRTLDITSNGKPELAGVSLMLFVLLYTPCMATVALIAREFSKKFALQSVALSLSFAYIVSVLVFQIGSLVW